MVPPPASRGTRKKTSCSLGRRPMTEDSSQPPPDDFQGRLRDLRERIGSDGGGAESTGAAPGSALGLAFRVGIELVAGLVVGAGLGWLLDRWWHTSPAMLILFFFLGAAAGIVNVIRATRDINRGR